MKKQSNLSRLLDYAGTYRILSYLSWVLAAVGALLALVPFWYIWRILREVIEVAPNYENAVHVTHYGWMAVVFAFAAVLTYIAGLMCSHLAAFRIATNLRLAMTKHIATLPLGEIEQFGSGKLRRTISETTGATETYLAHQLPDKARAVATIAGLLTFLMAFDWRLGLLSLVPVALAFAVMTSMTGKGMQEQMTQYQNALADMSGEAVEYVRGIPVVKTFGQTVFSFKKFKGAIDNYERWVIAYTKQLRWPMTFYTLAVNSVFVFLIAGGFLFSRGGADGGVLLNLLFYIIIDPEGEIYEKYKSLLIKTNDGRYIHDFSQEKAYMFYNAFHDCLKKDGAEFVKIDNQSMTRRFYKLLAPVGKISRNFHNAMEASVGQHFDNAMINCIKREVNFQIWYNVFTTKPNTERK